MSGPSDCHWVLTYVYLSEFSASSTTKLVSFPKSMGVFPIQYCISTLYLKQARYQQLSQAWITCTPELWTCIKSRRYDMNFVIWGCQEHVRRHWFKRIVIKKYLWRKPTLEMCMVLSGWFSIIAAKYNS